METTKRWPMVMSALLMVGLVSLVAIAWALDRSRPTSDEATATTTTTERSTGTTRPAGSGVLTAPGADPAAPGETEVLGAVQLPTTDFGSLFRRPSATASVPSIILPDFAALYSGRLNDQVTPSIPVIGPVVTSPPPTTPPPTDPPTTTAPPPTTPPPTDPPTTTAPPTTAPPTTEPPTTAPPTTDPPTTEPPPDTLPPDTTPVP